MEYIEIKDNIITGHYCGAMPENKNPEIEYREVMDLKAAIGDDVRFYSDFDKGIKKPLKQLVKEKLVAIPEGKKFNKTGDDFVDMTEAEKVKAGLRKLSKREKLDGDNIVQKCEKELYDDGIITAEAYNAYIDTMRETAYKSETDKLGLQVLRGEYPKEEWLEKITEIKKRYPKVIQQ